MRAGYYSALLLAVRVMAGDGLRCAAGSFHINDRTTGAVVGHQPSGGARASGTNDKEGSIHNLVRRVSVRTIGECSDTHQDKGFPFLSSVEQGSSPEGEGVASSILPEVAGLDGYRTLRRRDDVWDAARDALCERHGLFAGGFRRFPTGTHIVFGSEDLVIKVFCPLWPEDFAAERTALSAVTGLPVPGMIAHGELEGWPYIVMTRLPGIQVKLLWNGFDDRTRRSVLEQLGSLISGLQSLPAPRGLAVDWDDFVRRGVDGAQARHAQAGGQWAEWIGERLAGFSEPPFDPVFLHADITDEHLLMSEVSGRWTVTGLIDFGDAMTGHPHYELVAPFCCLCFGRPGMAEVLVEATGRSLDGGVRERLVTYCLLHRFGTLNSFLERFSVPDGPSFVEALFHTCS